MADDKIRRPAYVRFTQVGDIDIFVNPDHVATIEAAFEGNVDVTILRLVTRSNFTVLEPVEDVVEMLSSGSSRVYEPDFVKPPKKDKG